MPRKKRYDKNFNETRGPNVDAERRRRWEQSAAAAGVVADLQPTAQYINAVSTRQEYDVTSHSVLWLLEEISADSYLRIVPTGGMGLNHWFVKYTRGPWAGYYLYFAQRPCDPVPMAIATLAQRYHEVQAGKRKPTRDSAFGPVGD